MIRKGFVSVAHGQMHFRYAGQGPAVVLLHDSPRSSRMHEGLLQVLARQFTAIAIDTPGYGNSAPLPISPRPEIPDYAAALAGTLAALGIGPCPIYGFHTSSKILLQLAIDHPERVALGIIDGLNLPPGGPDEEFIRRYMKPFAVSDDGSHLYVTWAKAREFMRFFPWFEAKARGRLLRDFPDDEYLHGYVLDILSAGPHYSAAYSAAMRYLALPRLSQLRAPMVFSCRPNDPLYVYLDALPQPLPQGCHIERPAADPAAWQAWLIDLLAQSATQASASAPRFERLHAAGSRTGLSRRYCDAPQGQWHLCIGEPPQAAADLGPVLLLHDSPGSASGMLAIADQYLRAGRKVFAPDLPGQGESAPFPPNRPNTLDQYVSALLVLFDQLGIASVDIHAEFTGASLAFALAAQHPVRVRGIVADGVPLLGKRAQARLLKQYCPPLKVQADGSHLTSLWQRLRDQELTWPWYERSAAGVRKVDADLSGQRLHDQTLELAKQLPHYGDAALAALAANLEALLPQVNTPTLLLSDAGDPRHAGDRTVQRRLASARMTKRPNDAAQRVATALEFFARVARG